MTTYTNPGGRHFLDINTDDVTIGPDGGVIAHRSCSIWPCEVNRAGDSEAPYVADAHTLNPGDAAVSFRLAVAADHDERMRIFGAPGRSMHAEAMAAVCVPWPKQSEPVFRPPAIGRSDNPIVAWFRNQPIKIADLRMSKLPKLKLLEPGRATEVGKKLLPRFNRFAGDIWSGWATDDKTPDLQHAGYGSYYAGDVSQLLTVVLDESIDEDLRLKLVIAAVQRGLDLLGAFADRRRNWMVDGGHMWGRWPLVVFACFMLGVREGMHPSSLQKGDLVEFRAFYKSQDAWWCGGDAGWVRGWNEGRFLDKHPSQWTTTTRGQRWAITGYYEHVMGANLGLVMAIMHLGCPQAIGWGMCDSMRHWMTPLHQDAANDLRNNGCGGVADAWGTSYSAFSDGNLCAEAWTKRL